jgi:hypothetical protein
MIGSILCQEWRYVQSPDGQSAILNGGLVSDFFCIRRIGFLIQDGGYRPVSVFAVLHAVGVVSVLSALARGGLKTSNCHTLFGMAKIPTDNHIRSMLDPVHPSHLQSSFDQTIAEFARQGRHEKLPAP